MLLAWSLTEVIRYSFYALSLLSISAPALNYLRYTTFIPLYPLGAASEAFLSFATLPALAPVVSRAVTNVMAQAPREIMKSKVGREVLWWCAKHGGGTAGAQQDWGWIEIVRAGLFLLWWPGTSSSLFFGFGCRAMCSYGKPTFFFFSPLCPLYLHAQTAPKGFG